MRPLRAGLLVALLSAGLVAGCGGDGNATPPSKQEFIVKADEVCAAVADDAQRRGPAKLETADDIARAGSALADIYGKLRDGIVELDLPAGADRAGAQAYVDSVRATDPWLAKLRTTGDAFARATDGTDARALTLAGNDVRAALDGFRKARSDSDLLAIRYGFAICGNLG